MGTCEDTLVLTFVYFPLPLLIYYIIKPPLQSYAILRPQLLLTTYIESDLLRLIGTFRLADQSAVVLDQAENWALCLVFIRALAECIPRLRNELDQEDGRRYREAWARLGRTTEEADAFVRVVRVGAT